MVAGRPPTLFTEREYLALEGVAEVKHQYIGGEIVAMAGAEPTHNLICHNAHVELGVQLRERPCRAYSSDQRVKIEATRDYFYPDVVVTCVDPIFDDTKPRSLLNPQLVVEVLSPSTESYDRGAKWFAYQTVPTLTDYVLVASDRVQVEHYRRTPEGSWRYELMREGELRLSSGVTLDVRALYRLVPDLA